MDPLSFRDCAAWRAEGLPFSTSSNEACKLYDAILTQYVKWRNIDSIGGIEGCITRIKEADPDFVMGHVMSTTLELLGTATTPRLNQRLASAVKKTLELAGSQNLTPREKLHVKGLELLSHGNLPRASDVWEDILVDHPTDLLALKFAHDSYFYMGAQTQIRDSVARVLPHWKPHTPLSSYLKGLYSFGLLETHFYDQAEKVGMEALALVPDDAWSVHSVAHVYEMTAEVDKGLKFMEAREKDWQVSDMLATHNYWHWALYFIEKGQYEAALQIFDSRVIKHCKAKGSMLDLVDASSLLSRLEMEGVFVKDRYRDLLQVALPHTDDHVTLFNDLHILMVSLGAKETDASKRLLEGLQELAKGFEWVAALGRFRVNSEVVKENEITIIIVTPSKARDSFMYRTPGDDYHHKLAEPIGVPMCQALMEYDEGNYDQTVELLYPLRYSVVQIGGSDAQRDVFNQLLIHAALKSENKRHQRLGRCLLVEREATKPNSPLTDRLMQRAVALHH